MNSFISEIKSKWKQISLLTLLCVFELILFSSLFSIIPLYLMIIVLSLILSGIVTFLVICIKEKNPDKKDLKSLGIFIVIALICGVARSYLFIISLLIAYIFYDDKQKMYKWLFITSAVCLGGIVLLCFASVIPDIPMFRQEGIYIVNVRHTFGFSHPNHILKFYFSMVIWGYLWLGKNWKKTLLFTISVLPFALLFAHNTNCRTGLMTILGTLIIMNFPILVKWMKFKWLYIIFVVFTLVLVLCKNIEVINNELSGRPYWFYFFISEYPFHILFGKAYIGLMNYPLDNGIMYTIFDGGIVTLILICYLFYISFKNKEDIKVKVVMISILVYSMFEALSTIYVNPLYILMFMELLDIYFFRTKIREKNPYIQK